MADAQPDPSWFADTFESVKNWGRWGPDDERGTLNLLTPERTAAAAALVRTGRVVSCALDLDSKPGPDNPQPALHMMRQAGDAAEILAMPGFQQTNDFFGVACHGMSVTHLDALCHVLVGGQMYNGGTSADVLSTGAQRNSVLPAAGGICGRGVLLDIPLLRGVEWLDRTDRVLPADLEAAEQQHGVEVGAGDIVLVNTGRARRRRAEGRDDVRSGLAGLHPYCIPWLHERDVAVLGGDAIQDPFGLDLVPPWPLPVHQLLIAAAGVHLLDNADLDPLSRACIDEQRWAFQFVIAPLRIPRATGSPVTPLAIF